jgi:hypothetical protein
MIKKLGITLISFCLLAGAAGAVDYYVDATTTEGNVVGDGSSGNPWQTITYALTQTSTYDVINVRPGTYSAAMSGSQETFPLQIVDKALVGTVPHSATIQHNLSHMIQVDGATIEALSLYVYAGYIAIQGSGLGTNTIHNNRIYGNNSTNSYGIRFDANPGLHEPGAVITSNEVWNFGRNGMQFSSSGGKPVTIEGNTIYNCQAGILINNWDAATIKKNLVRDLKNPFFTTVDAGITVYYGTTAEVEISNNTVVGNATGILISNLTDCSVTVENNVVTSAPDVGDSPRVATFGDSYGIKTLSNTGTVIDNDYNDIWNNVNDYMNITAGAHSISQCPQFVNSGGNDYTLLYNSPCINAGDPASPADPDGSIADIGRYPFDLSQSGVFAVNVQAPNGGEGVVNNTTFEVTWYATKEGASIDHIELDLSINGGSTFPYTVATNEANDGSYVWTANDVPSTSQGIMRVTAVAAGSAADQSDEDFNIFADFYVNVVSGDNTNLGTSEGSPWKNLSYAATQAASGATIHVREGLYNAAAGESFPITIAAGVIATSEASPTTLATIDAESASAHAVVLGDGATLDGFTVKHSVNGAYVAVNLNGNGAVLKNCRVERATTDNGGYAVQTQSPKSNCRIENNIISTDYSVALYILGGCTNALVKDNTITNSRDAGDDTARGIASQGGNDHLTVEGNTVTANEGLQINFDNSTITQNKFIASSSNTNALYGILLNQTGHKVTSNEVRGYRSADLGHAALLLQGSGDVFNNTLIDNATAILIRNASLTIKNNIIAGTGRLDAEPYSSSIVSMRVDTSNATVTYNNVWKVGSEYTGSGTVNASNNFSVFPGFVSPEADDYRLQSDNAYWTNACIGAGEGGVNVGAYDPVDLGTPYRTTSYTSGTGSDSTGDGTSWGTAWRTLAKANQYTVNNINLGVGTYTAVGPNGFLPMYLSIDRYLKGVDRNNATIEAGTGGATGIILVNDNSSVEYVTIDPNGATPSSALNVIGQGVIIKNNLVNSQGVSDGGIYSAGGAHNLTVEGNVIWRTTYSSGNNGIDIISSNDLDISRNEIRRHWIGIELTSCGGSSTVNRNTLVQNDWAAIYTSNATASATNNIMAAEVGGYSAASSHGIEVVGIGSVASSYNCFFANDANYTGNVTNKTGDIISDPVFEDAAANNYYLQETSPCIDAGTPAGTEMGAYDYVPPGPGPTVTVLAPNGGETLAGGSTYAITWTAEAAVVFQTNPITISYSTNSGSTWSSIVSGTANDASYSWTVPEINTATARVRVQAVDYWGKTGTDESDANFTIQTDADAPSISIQVNGVAVRSNDPISSTPRIVAVITDENGSPKDGRMYLDGVMIPTAQLKRDFLLEDGAYVLHLVYEVEDELSTGDTAAAAGPRALAAGDHGIKVEGWDYAGNLSTLEVTGLRVATETESAALTATPLLSAPTLSPAADGSEEISIAYVLNKDVRASIVMVGMAGEAVWTRHFIAGESGAAAGYNVVAFNGISDVTGQPLGNGIYVYQIVADGKVIGKGHIVIFE